MSVPAQQIEDKIFVARWPEGYFVRLGARFDIVDPRGGVVATEGDTLRSVDACQRPDGTWLIHRIGEVVPGVR